MQIIITLTFEMLDSNCDAQTLTMFTASAMQAIEIG